MARLIWTEPALHDLDAIADYIALDKPDAAKKFVRRVFTRVEKLRKFPRIGAVPVEILDLPYRQLIVPPCRILIASKESASTSCTL
jgi:toxin ParE1/3/4